MMPEGIFLLTGVGYSSKSEPYIQLYGSDFLSFNPLGQTLSLHIDSVERHCTGWRNIKTSEQFACPDTAVVDKKYDQCPACQKRTGFNPAFYHADSVSAAQEKLNQEPHLLYLAHFAPGIVKVGITHSRRGIARLLEQGARTAMALETFPTALIARQYEARIAALPGVVEHLRSAQKLTLLQQSYNATNSEAELKVKIHEIQTALNISFESPQFHDLNPYYADTLPSLSDVYDTSPQKSISGEVVGMIGTTLITKYQTEYIVLPLKQYVGYMITISKSLTTLDLPARQATLF